MDSRDSSSSSAAAATNREGEDDGALSATAALAKEAAMLFESRKYAECVSVMHQLAQKKEDDPKVLHNLAIAEFFRDGCSDTKKLLDMLNLVKRKSEQLARASGEQAEAGGAVGNKVALGSKGSSATNQLSTANASPVVYADEYDTSVALHNIAVLWFHLHDYSRVLSALEPLYHNIEPIDETTALHICLLLLDALLACQDASKSVDVFNYLEKAFGVGSGASQGDSASAAQQQAANLVAKSSSVPSGSSTADALNSDPSASVNAIENPLSRTLSEETLEYENMLKTLDISGQNIGRPAGLSSSNDVSRSSVDRSIPAVDLKFEMQTYKVQILLLTRNLKLAKREVKHAINFTRGRDSSMALLLKSQLEHARGNHRKAIKLLMASSNRTETGLLSMFNNNLGCIYYQLGKPHTSSIFFSKALANCSSLRKEKPVKLSTSSQDKSLLIMYNCGMQYLDCGKPVLAARCFQKASLVFYNRPLLWLRLAECCLMALEKGLVCAEGNQSDRLEVKVIGKGKWRQLAMDDGISKKGLVDFVERDGWFLSNDGPPKLSMSLARQCILNALHLLNSSESSYYKSGLPSNFFMEENESIEAGSTRNTNHRNITCVDLKASTVSANLGQVNVNGDVKEQKGGAHQENIQSSLFCYEDARRKENLMMKQVLLANLAFVELELQDPLKALSTARTLLKLPECSRIVIFLGHVYAAEALCLLNRPKEAAELLSVYLSGGNNVQIPYSQEDQEQWRVQKTVDCEEQNGGTVSGKSSSSEESQGINFIKPEEAQGVLFANFATLAALQGEFEQARLFAKQALSIIPNSPEARLTAVYVDLIQGKSQDALIKLKQCNQVRIISSSTTLGKSNS